jgi:hypothetical protein
MAHPNLLGSTGHFLHQFERADGVFNSIDEVIIPEFLLLGLILFEKFNEKVLERAY